jgi:TPR repeat protein
MFFYRNKMHILFSLIFLCSGGIKIMCQPKVDDSSQTTVGSDIISESLLEQKEIEAMNGNAKVADEIADHFWLGKMDYPAALYWLGIGAENGHLESYRGLVILLSLNKNYGSRSLYWLHRMMIANYRSRDVLNLIEQLGLSVVDIQPPDDDLFSFTATPVFFSDEEIIYYEEGALCGSGRAALILANYYREVSIDLSLSEYWYQIGAQNGNVECYYQLSHCLKNSSNKLKNIRSLFWLKRAALNGHSRAKEELHSITQR